jgi:hypothetical protein
MSSDKRQNGASRRESAASNPNELTIDNSVLILIDHQPWGCPSPVSGPPTTGHRSGRRSPTTYGSVEASPRSWSTT